jgi:surface antigen
VVFIGGHAELPPLASCASVVGIPSTGAISYNWRGTGAGRGIPRGDDAAQPARNNGSIRTTMPNAMFLKTGFLPAVIALSVLAGCSSTTAQKSDDPKFRVGSLQTQVAGGDPKLAASGQLVGAFLGKGVEAPLDETDKPLIEDATRKAYALPIGEKSSWKNEKSGHEGYVISIRDGWRTNGVYCREVQETVLVGKDTYQGYGAACKQTDGAWKRIDPKDLAAK